MGRPNSLNFVTLDVFTTTVFKGNQLALVHVPSSQDLPQETKQAIAREFNFSETVFLHDNDLNVADRRLDIFTLTDELPFAGHPTIGTICYVCQSADPPLERVTLRIKAGTLIGRYNLQNGLAEAEIPHDVHLHEAGAHKKDFLACQTGINPGPGWPTTFPVVSVCKGMTFILAEFPDTIALAALQSSEQKISYESISLDESWTPSFLSTYYYVITEKMENITKIRSRMLEPRMGEDPCTGSGASSLASYLSIQDGKTDGTYIFLIEQGVEMNRAGEMQVRVTLDASGKGIRSIVLAGRSVLVSKGTLTLP